VTRWQCTLQNPRYFAVLSCCPVDRSIHNSDVANARVDLWEVYAYSRAALNALDWFIDVSRLWAPVACCLVSVATASDFRATLSKLTSGLRTVQRHRKWRVTYRVRLKRSRVVRQPYKRTTAMLDSRSLSRSSMQSNACSCCSGVQPRSVPKLDSTVF